MNGIKLTALLFLLAPSASYALTVTASSCSVSAVSAAIDLVSNGDTVRIPAGECTWSSALNYSKGITLRGETDCVLNSTGIPTSCSTIIVDGIVGTTSLIWITSSAGLEYRISNIEFRDGGFRTGGVGPLRISGQTDRLPHDGRFFRFDHNRTIRLDDEPTMSLGGIMGLIDSNYIDLVSGDDFIYLDASTENEFAYPDTRWAEPSNFGSSDFVFMEHNQFDRTLTASASAVTDADRGSRYVFRKNISQDGNLGAHGTESGGRQRGHRATEVYDNIFLNANGFQLRSGTLLGFRNSYIYASGISGLASLQTNRLDDNYSWACTADGTCLMDVNDPGNPQASFVVASTAPGSAGTLAITVTPNPGWTTNEWQGYIVKKQGCESYGGVGSSNVLCSGSIRSNTSSTTLLVTNLSENDIGAGDTIDFNLITHMWDNGCRGGESPALEITTKKPDITSTLFTATATETNHGLTVGTTIMVTPADAEHEGVYIIDSVLDANTFTYQLRYATAAFSNEASVTVLPANWNSQVTEGCYSWKNVNMTTLSESEGIQTSLDSSLTNRENEHYFNYAGSSQTALATPWNGTVGVGVGVVAFRPSTCTTGVAYWATDEGEWDSTNGATADGRLYKCTATDTWTLFYTPYTYPHPRTEESTWETTIATTLKGGFKGRGGGAI